MLPTNSRLRTVVERNVVGIVQCQIPVERGAQINLRTLHWQEHVQVLEHLPEPETRHVIVLG